MTTTTTLPAYTPAKSLHRLHGRDQLAKAYGKPPEGYRFLKIGETIPVGSIHAENFGKGKWGFVTLATGHKVNSGHLLIAAPITPELIPDDPSAAVALEVVGRNSKVVRFKIARQSDVVKYGELFKASNKLQIESVHNPQILFSRGHPHGKFYLRGVGKRNDGIVLSCTPKRFERIVAALAEYNASLAPKVAPVPVSSEPPKYTGPEIKYSHSLEDGINAAGPAPEGWRYLKLGEGVKDGDFRLRLKEWQKDVDIGLARNSPTGTGP